MYYRDGRQEFVNCKCRKTAKRHCPWARRIMKVAGGFMAFDSIWTQIGWKRIQQRKQYVKRS